MVQKRSPMQTAFGVLLVIASSVQGLSTTTTSSSSYTSSQTKTAQISTTQTSITTSTTHTPTRCGPGTHVDTNTASCVPCKLFQYMDLEQHTETSCRTCSVDCPSGTYFAEPCTRVKDTTCNPESICSQRCTWTGSHCTKANPDVIHYQEDGWQCDLGQCPGCACDECESIVLNSTDRYLKVEYSLP